MSSEEVPTGYLLKRAHAALRHAMDTALGEEGLSMAQYAALAALTRDDDLTNAELANASQPPTTSPTLSTNEWSPASPKPNTPNSVPT
jgi:predicted pyridoxine 5'-phosphate oxidase superfamily flavin-nucleotide-binding protein